MPFEQQGGSKTSHKEHIVTDCKSEMERRLTKAIGRPESKALLL